MRNLTHLAVPKDSNVKFPFATIRNETPTEEGTPVVRELYGDIITNVWKIIQLSGITFTGDEDSDDTQYQLVDALRKSYNTLNDVEQVISLAGGVWSVPINIDLLPNKYVFIGRAGDDYVSTTSYQFKGSTATLISATSPTGFKTNDEVLTVIDTAGVRMYSLTKLTSNISATFTVLGAPLSFNDSDTMYYLADGKIFTDAPSVADVEAAIQTSGGNVNLVLADAIVLKGKLVCLVYDLAAQVYRIYTFDLNDLATATECSYQFFAPVTGVDNGVYMFSDGTYLYLTNEFNDSADSESVYKVLFTEATNTLTLNSTLPLAGFVKTTNAVITGNKLYTFIAETLKSHDLGTFAVATVFDNFSLFVGNLFAFNGGVYYTKNDVATPWNI